jgi:hypothetical protein
MRWILFIAFIWLFASCKKEVTSTTPVQENVDTTTAEVKFDGVFMNGPYGAVSGAVKIYKDSGAYQVALIDMMNSNGPDLHVYLSKEEQPIHFIDLGKLKSTSGNQVYPVATTPDFSQYQYVLIHCQKYNHLFGSAQVAP